MATWHGGADTWQAPSEEPTTQQIPMKTFSVCLERVTKAVCITGCSILIDVMGRAPEGYKTFEASASSGLLFNVEGTKFNFGFAGHPSRWYLQPSCMLKLQAVVPSCKMFSEWIRVTYFKYGEERSSLVAMMIITCISLSLSGVKRRSVNNNDDNKNKKKEIEEKRKNLLKKYAQNPWEGPIMLVNCGCKSEYPPESDNQEEEILYEDDVRGLAKVILDINTPCHFFVAHQLVISCSHPDKVRLFGPEGSPIHTGYKMVLGPNRPSHTVGQVRHKEKRTFYVEALTFPNADFSGMISFTVTLLNVYHENGPEYPIHNVGEAFRVAPWMMVSNIQPPKEIFVTGKLKKWPLHPWRFWRDTENLVRVKWLTGSAEPRHHRSRNRLIPESTFLNALRHFAHEANCDLNFCPDDRTRLETWIGKEVAIGYTYSPQQRYPVVLDVPWNRDFNLAFKNFLKGNFGYVRHEREDDDNLDVPGFLEVSPPVTAHGIVYPLGRILIGDGSLPREEIPEVNLRLRRFIYAQNVQDPLELFSEWLLEGNVKEFLTFVPASDGKGFRLLLASPNACYELFKREQSQGYGLASVLDKVDRSLLSYTERVKMSINDILADKSLWRQNDYVQTCITWNRKVLKAELGLSEKDIIDIPQLFRLGWVKDPATKQEVLRAGHFFPNMLNMIVLGTCLGIPKPFGPVINGVCCVEKTVRNLLEPLGLHCLFIEEFFGHQEDWEDAYYWINVSRVPLPSKWWMPIT
ncbi:protein-arginine deiminase type-4-like [Antechinus flavipes]|uniref:protein-arginine deiminase type-4-like n=1 Tax=Antechinus flavipes TaxID=38775 RepID=UPI0022354670|nr:protein-arginine deiminase type-4-like [Antechinus flavipes]